jgi:putative heme-binding domain-containing protein
LRDVPFAQSKNALLALASGFDGRDRTMLEAIGTGAKGKEAEFYAALSAERGSVSRSASAPKNASGKLGAASTTDAAAGHSPALQWASQFAWLAWRLHPPQAIPEFKTRALAEALPDAERKRALTAIAFNDTKSAADAMLDIAAKTDKAVRAEALWWLLHKKDNSWKDHGLAAALKERGIYDPDKIELTSIVVPEPPKVSQPLIAAAIAKLKGDAKRGAQIATACHACHRIGNDGAEYAPNLTGWASRQPLDVVVRSIAEPSADIAHGFGGHELTLKDGTVIHGLLLADADPVIIMSTGAITQTVPKDRIRSKKPLGRSLMLSAEQMGMGPQELADVIAFLRTK